MNTDPLSPPLENINVVEVTTKFFSTKNGVHLKKSVSQVKKHSKGYQIITEGSVEMGAEKLLKNIVNLHQVDDGLYLIKQIGDPNIYRLIPFLP